MEQAIPDRKRRYTVEEYFKIMETSDVKYEYRDGELVPHGGWARDDKGQIIGMAGGTAEHSEIACNFIRELGNRLKGRPCKVHNSDLGVKLSRSGRYGLPDVSVTCGTPVFDPPEARRTLVNPQVLIEVLSESTEAEDRGEKFRDYIAIESLKQYLLVSQDRPLVQTFNRATDGSWAVGPWAEGLDASVAFPSLGVTIPLAEVYAGITFPPPRPSRGILPNQA